MGNSRTGGQHSFAQIPAVQLQRSTFNRSCGLKTAFNAGELIPIFLDEALPGDTINMKVATMARMSTLIRPVMENMYLDIQFFAVPNRLLWQNWERFNGAQDNPTDSTDFEVPVRSSPAGTGYLERSLADYMGIPPGVPDIEHSALFFRAYNFVWNEWYRDENNQIEQPWSDGDGPDDAVLAPIMKRGKRHDYFTSCLPWPQKGDAVLLPLGGIAPVRGAGDGLPTFNIGAHDSVNLMSGLFSDPPMTRWSEPALVENIAATWDEVKLEADLSSATAATINQIRQAFQVQKLLERDARGGTRYTEILRSHFGVTSPDARLQRPEYLGGAKNVISVNPVAQTAPTGGAGQQNPGDLSGFAVGGGVSGGFVKSFTEHCIIIGLASFRADLNYQQGVERMWKRKTRYDFYWPSFAHLGEQTVLQQEIFASGVPAEDDIVFGYQERYAEYRYKPSQITGVMRSSDSQSLDTWHLAQDFSPAPILAGTFMQEDPPVARILVLPGQPHLLLDAFFDYKHTRAMPVYSVPGMIDRF